MDRGRAPRGDTGFDAGVLGEAVHGRAGPGDQVSAEVEPVVAALLGPHPPADAVRRLEQDHPTVAKLLRGNEPRDTAADDADVVVDLSHALSRSSSLVVQAWIVAPTGAKVTGEDSSMSLVPPDFTFPASFVSAGGPRPFPPTPGGAPL